MAKYYYQLCCGASDDGALELLSEAMLGAVRSRAGEVGYMVTE